MNWTTIRSRGRRIAEKLRKGDVTLLYAASDKARNNAVALREYLSLSLQSKQAT